MAESKWKFHLFECFDTPIACLWATCVPCGIACMQTTTTKLSISEEDAHIKACLFAVFLCCFGVAYNRTNIRKQLVIEGSYLEDCLFALCCPCCSMVREWREVMVFKSKKEDEFVWRAYRGYDQI